jgi:hypothetical protein
MADRGLHQLPVTRDGRLLGLLTRSSVIQYLALHAGHGPSSGRGDRASGRAADAT